jgi:hypothetical protein
MAYYALLLPVVFVGFKDMTYSCFNFSILDGMGLSCPFSHHQKHLAETDEWCALMNILVEHKFSCRLLVDHTTVHKPSANSRKIRNGRT